MKRFASEFESNDRNKKIDRKQDKNDIKINEDINKYDAKELFALAKCYENGTYVEEDQKKAIELYTLAAEAGNSKAQNNLAILYKDGNGVDKNNIKRKYEDDCIESE